ncbi:MAG TPA: A/G-specific adenine glycosylase, partial [Gammaproteobacteria bacterium]|nr:A/G-specific adenine glycosylase [Gammaproteobacteria bacterium]
MNDFATNLLGWSRHSGRHDLPWQRPRTPYRVWVSEVMLQQTQVATAIPYFERFMARFEDVKALAAAPLDEVLHHWTGLGYYSRARNLHAAACLVRDRHHGVLPASMAELRELPGIGRSTAAAILALAYDQKAAILDGNVKRILSRYFAIQDWPGGAAMEQRLWRVAEGLLPERDIAAYTQAIMDLGALVCTRRRPLCGVCPVAGDC